MGNLTSFLGWPSATETFNVEMKLNNIKGTLKFLGHKICKFVRQSFGAQWGLSGVSSAYKSQFGSSNTSNSFQKYRENLSTQQQNPAGFQSGTRKNQ
ncbi:hypothetical protein AYI69_g388 [Smittium culicis]|uniref:Uncharacterized protein n=1 Tax=Smittium culicis TaxID=133412 RepID=A0A1R1YT76_9FUNG|nr:hypothetical protein AYI69_g388 [Smittium culicis]